MGQNSQGTLTKTGRESWEKNERNSKLTDK